MKTLFLKSFFAVAFSFASVFAFAGIEGDKYPTASKQLHQLLKDFPIEITDGEISVNLTFVINDKNEIIVLSTNNKKLDDKFKGLLNYKKLMNTDLVPNQTYILPVTLKS